MDAINEVRKLYDNSCNPNVLQVPSDLYDDLVLSIPEQLRFSRNDGTENIIFPVFSNCKVIKQLETQYVV